jgi:hypothetical protein
VITGKAALDAEYGFWTGFEAAHIFPLAYEQHWIDNAYSRWVTVPATSGGPINSVQNGMLLKSDIHALFDSYQVSINPDVRMTCLSRAIVANNLSRIVTRLFASESMGRILLAGILINDFSKTHVDQPISYSAGILGRQC